MAEDKKTKELSSKISLADQFTGRASVIKGKDGKKSRRKPGIPYSNLRNLSRNNDVVRVVIDRVKHRVTKTPWFVRAKDSDKHESLKPFVDYVTKLLEFPNNNDDTFRTLVSKIVEDILALDRGCVEKVRNAKGEVVELHQVDGSTIYPNIDEYGLFQEPAYYQFFQDTVEPIAELEDKDMLTFVMNPSGEAGRLGYGNSPIENIISTVMTSLQGMMYNADYFDSEKVPPFWANLAGVPLEELNRFSTAFKQQLDSGNWKSPFTNADKADIKLLRPTNQDMQFYELNLWLTRIVCSEFEISPEEIGLTMNSNRSTAEEQKGITSEGIDNVLRVISEEFNNDLIGDLAETIDERFNEIEFVWDSDVEMDEKQRAEIDEIQIKNGLRTVDELRERDGLDPIKKPATVNDILAKHRIRR